MSNETNTKLMELAIDIVDEKYAKGVLPSEAREFLIKAEYDKLMSTEPTTPEEMFDDDSGEEEGGEVEE